MDPVIYNFSINERGTTAELLTGDGRILPQDLLRLERAPLVRADLH